MDWACKVYPYERVGQVSLRPGNWKWCGTCGRKWFDSIPLTSLTSRTHTLDKLVQTRNPVLFTGSEDGHVELVSLWRVLREVNMSIYLWCVHGTQVDHQHSLWGPSVVLVHAYRQWFWTARAWPSGSPHSATPGWLMVLHAVKGSPENIGKTPEPSTNTKGLADWIVSSMRSKSSRTEGSNTKRKTLRMGFNSASDSGEGWRTGLGGQRSWFVNHAAFTFASKLEAICAPISSRRGIVRSRLARRPLAATSWAVTPLGWRETTDSSPHTLLTGVSKGVEL